MRLLFLTYEIPWPPDSGDRIYTASLLRELRQRGHEVDVVAFDRASATGGGADGVASADARVGELATRTVVVPFRPKTRLQAVASRFPGMIANRLSAQYLRTASRLARTARYDAVLVNHFKMAYLAEPLRRRASRAPLVLIAHNAEAALSRTVYRHQSARWKSAVYFVDWIKTRRYERRFLRSFDAVTAISALDRDVFKRDYGLREVALVPPGIDTDAYCAGLAGSGGDRAVIVCGSFLWAPKRLNLLRLLDSRAFCEFARNDLQLYIVGQAEPSLVDAVNRKYRGVVMTGAVTDVQPYYRKCAVALVPELMGGGFKLKVLEAAAMKRAIVCLSGAMSAPGFVAGEHFVEAHDMEELITATVRLVSDPPTLSRLARAAHQLVRRHYTWKASGDRLIDAVTRAAGRRASKR